MNPYKEDGPCARLSFDRAYCKRCTAPPSVNDGYIRGPGCPTDAAGHRKPAGRRSVPATTRVATRQPAARRAARLDGTPRDAIGAIETLVRQRSNGAFIMRV